MAVVSWPAWADQAADGWAAYDAGHFVEAVAIWRTLASAGQPEAQLGLGVAFDLGQGVKQDEAEACRWYRDAGERGLDVAQFNTAVMYDAGRCGPRDTVEAAIWYARAAAAGHGRAQYDLAQLYAAGDGVPRNLDQAAIWYGLAARHGVSAAGEALRSLSVTKRPPTGPEMLQPVLPSAPRQAIPFAASKPFQVAFVWQAPSQPTKVSFFLEVHEIVGSEQHEVFAQYIAESAALVPLQPKPAHYLWRVYVVSTGFRAYAVSPACEFDTKAELQP